MTIPDDEKELAHWLGTQLVGQNLSRLIAELRAVHGDQSTITSLEAILAWFKLSDQVIVALKNEKVPESVLVKLNPLKNKEFSRDDFEAEIKKLLNADETKQFLRLILNHPAILGSNAQAILESGLSVLPRSALQDLLRNSSLLLELQELVLVEGGAYWSELPVKGEYREALNRGWERLSQKIASHTQVQRRGFLRRVLPYALTNLATAAAIIVAFFTFPLGLPQATAKAWGWQKPDAFPTNLDRSSYLNRLADEADEWFNKRPDNPAAAAKRILEFRQGCSFLLLADHSSLTPADRDWLKEKCRKWSETLDSTLVSLEKNQDTAAAIAAVDAMVRNLSNALREKAAA